MSDVNVNFPPSASPFRAVAAGEVEALVNGLRAEVEGQMSLVDEQVVGVSNRLTDIAVNIKNYWLNVYADWTPAFQSAIEYLDTLGGGNLIVPKDDYKVSGSINAESNITIQGIGYPRIYTETGTGYFSIFKKNLSVDVLENVTIKGLFIDQWPELNTSLQPDNMGKPCCAIAFMGTCINITIEDNIIRSIGGWAISVSDTTGQIGSVNTYIRKNKVFWKIAGTVWYDASAIYAETDNHFIENNYVEAIRPTNPGDSRWRIEGGIETHGIGSVRWNTVKNAQAGINVVGHVYDTVTRLKAKREISFNTLHGVNRGIWFWPSSKDGGLENLEIFSNDIEVVAEGMYAGYGAIVTVLRELNYTDPTNGMTGDIKRLRIYNNKFKFVGNGYTGTEYFQLTNVGAIHLSANGSVQDVKIYDNEIIGFPWPALVTSQWDYNVSRQHKDLEMYNNTIVDCGWDMPNAFQKVVFYPTNIDRVSIHDNTIKWVTKNTTGYLIASGSSVLTMEYIRNKQISENGFTLTATNVTNVNLATTNIDAKNLGYRENAGTPVGVLTPKKIGEDVFDTTNKNFYKAVGLTSADWKVIS